MHRYARLSLAYLVATVLMTTVHHVFRMGTEVLPAALVLLVAPPALLWWFRARRHRAAAWLYAGTAAFVVVWFGVVDGGADHVVKLLGLPNLTLLPGSDAEVVATVYSLWSPGASDAFYEWTGIATFLLSIPTTWFTYRFVQAVQRDRGARTAQDDRSGTTVASTAP